MTAKKPPAARPPAKQPEAPPDDSSKPDPYMEKAYREEQENLNEALRRAQSEHLFNRVIVLSAEVQRLKEEIESLKNQDKA